MDDSDHHRADPGGTGRTPVSVWEAVAWGLVAGMTTLALIIGILLWSKEWKK